MRIDKRWYKKPKDKNFPVRSGAGGVIVRKEGEKILIGLVRPNRFKTYILPKGGKEKGETFLEAAIREIGEEAGITNLKLLTDLGICERLTFKKNYWSRMHYFLFSTRQKDGQPTDPFESYQIEWFDIDNLPPMFWPEQGDLIEKNKGKIKDLVKEEFGI